MMTRILFLSAAFLLSGCDIVATVWASRSR